MSLFTKDNSPGMTASISSEEVAITRVGRFGYNPLVETPPLYLKSSITDSGNTPTTTIRAGQLIAQQTADSKGYVYSPYANDGTQLPVGVLDHYTSMLVNGVATDKWVALLNQGLLQTANILGLDAHAKAVLYRMGFKSDALVPDGGLFLVQERKRQLKAADYTVTAADNGDLFVTITGAVTYTLPTMALGLSYEFLQTTANNMVIGTNGATGDIIADNTLAAKTLTYSTSSHQIGAHLRVRCIAIDTSGTLKWMFENLSSASTITIGT